MTRRAATSAIRPVDFPISRCADAPAWLSGQRGGRVVRPAFVLAPEPALEPAGPEAQAGAGVDEPTAAAPMPNQELARLQAEAAAAGARAEAEGRARGEAEGKATYEEHIRRVSGLAAELAGVRGRYRAEMEQQMIELSLCVARSVLGRELSGDREHVPALVREALDLVTGDDEVTVTVAPADLPLVKELSDDPAGDPPRLSGLLVRADERIQAGCVVETRLARVDATLESRLRNVAERLLSKDGEGQP